MAFSASLEFGARVNIYVNMFTEQRRTRKEITTQVQIPSSLTSLDHSQATVCEIGIECLRGTIPKSKIYVKELCNLPITIKQVSGSMMGHHSTAPSLFPTHPSALSKTPPFSLPLERHIIKLYHIPSNRTYNSIGSGAFCHFCIKVFLLLIYMSMNCFRCIIFFELHNNPTT